MVVDVIVKARHVRAGGSDCPAEDQMVIDSFCSLDGLAPQDDCVGFDKTPTLPAVLV